MKGRASEQDALAAPEEIPARPSRTHLLAPPAFVPAPAQEARVRSIPALPGRPRRVSWPLFSDINSHQTNRALRTKVIGSAQLGLGRKSVIEQEVYFPPVSEQSAIAAVLSDMDAELDALEVRCDKVQSLKHAMMQELLTGKTRLVAPEAAHA